MAIGWFIGACVLFVAAMCLYTGLVFASEEEEQKVDQPMPTVTIETEIPEDRSDITIAAKAVWGEARGVESEMEQAAVVWCFLNRVDKYGNTLGEVVTEPNQFHYNKDFPTVDDYGRDLEELVKDVVDRWVMEQSGQTNVGRVLPREYIYFSGDGEHNHFRTDYADFSNVYDWTLENPYRS